ncbi:MAG: hypothetical protein N3B10_09740 [Armatimonadetes bacterium]|nr:hypothetical protein [Armatimonadota bacterium]
MRSRLKETNRKMVQEIGVVFHNGEPIRQVGLVRISSFKRLIGQDG